MTLSLRSTVAALAIAALCAPVAVSAQHTESTMLGKWTGTFRTTQFTQSSLNEAGNPGTINGDVRMTPTNEGGVDMYVFNIKISMNRQGQSLEWGVSRGRCGSKLIMLEPAGIVPTIETRSGGEGELRYTMPLDLDAKSSYQLVLFRGGHLQQNVVACANLKYDDRMR